MSKKNKLKDRLTLRLPVDMVKQMKEYVNIGDFDSISQLSRHALKGYFENHLPEAVEKVRRKLYENLCGGHPDRSFYNVVMDGISNMESSQKERKPYWNEEN